ncbi:uncharacterized protein BDZ99DRAFT_493519 [Mytilinidion resinicola]|uniref:TPR-like protein n=1 Tax=Mytilinidion resinicola TaxID=574789 RepID=A0A6A6Z9S4_9PEZI|nr:uncharacterized protein BDZ99DRAFT_493519 [Mytilinidion resinicola]KAF2817766.1 hypothetical protein BDZ99DRAFT_493519 [Mytilinidion resinicola]
MSQNLSILIATNDPSLISKFDSDKIPITATQPTDLTTRNDIAMTLTLYNFTTSLPATSHPSFTIPASALPAFISALYMPTLHIWTIQSTLSISLPGTEGREAGESTLSCPLLHPLTHAPLAPTFFALLPSTLSTLHHRYTGAYPAAAHLAKLQSLQLGAVEAAQTGSFAQAADRYAMALRFAHVVWECHLESVRGLVGVLWALTLEIYADRTQVLLNIANAAAGDKGGFELARENAEEGVVWLDAREGVGDGVIGGGKEREGVRRGKAKLSFRAAVACQGAGDKGAAVGYLREAIRLEPESRDVLQKRIEEVGGGEGETGGRAAVVWRR